MHDFPALVPNSVLLPQPLHCERSADLFLFCFTTFFDYSLKYVWKPEFDCKGSSLNLFIKKFYSMDFHFPKMYLKLTMQNP